MTDRKSSESKGLCLPWNRAILDDIGSQGRLDSCVHLYPGGSQAVSSWVSEVTALCLCLLRGSWAPQDLPLDPRTPGEKGGSYMHTWRSLGLLPHTPRWVGGEWRMPRYLSLPGAPHGLLSHPHIFWKDAWVFEAGRTQNSL